MTRVVPDSSTQDEPISEAHSVTMPTNDESTIERDGASTPDSAHRTAWPPNEAPPPYSEQPGDQDQFSEHSFEPPPPYESATPSTNSVPMCDRLGAQPETTRRGAHRSASSHHSSYQGSGVSTCCLVVLCIFCPFLFIFGFIVFAVSMSISMCAEKCCGREECAGKCQRQWERLCP